MAASTSFRVTPERSKSLVFIGDSVVWGTGSAPASKFWSFLDASLHGTARITALGRTGLTIEDAFELVPNDSSRGVVLVEVGADDVLRGISTGVAVKSYKPLLARVSQRCPRSRILLSNVAYMPSLFRLRPGLLEQTLEMNRIIKTLASRYCCLLVDLYAFSTRVLEKRRDVIGPDGIHPNEEGEKLLAKFFASAVRSDLA